MKLIFVYNADSGPLNTLFDIAHKIIQPQTYQCNLCSLTHGAFTEKQAWKAFKDRGMVAICFYHRDEFEKEYGLSFPYPVILKQNHQLEQVFSADEIAKVNDVEELIQMIEKTAI